MASQDKYDRQLRLWGSHGQRCLAGAHILLVQANGAGCETMKNLVLPGIGRFTVADDSIVSEADLDCNFFIRSTDLGRNRAEVAAELLCEMNPDVRGDFILANPKNLVEEMTKKITSYSLVIASNVPSTYLEPLAKLLAVHDIPLIIQQSLGLLGWIRIQTKCHHVIESKPDSERLDLRISQPFDELLEFCKSIDLTQPFEEGGLDSRLHSHVPYIVILVQAVDLWMKKHGRMPKSSEEKSQFKKLISMSSRDSQEVNYIEAIQNAYYAHTSTEISEEVVSVLYDKKSTSISTNSSDFSCLLEALRIFLQKHSNVPPLSGQLPDMTATTDYFLQLQQVYQKKASRDRLEFRDILSGILKAVGRSPTSIPDELVDLFCKNVNNLRQISTRTYEQELLDPAVEIVKDALDDPYIDEEQTPILWYLTLRAAHLFYHENGRWPGDIDDSNLEEDVNALTKHLSRLEEQYQIGKDNSILTRNYAVEIARYGGIELHNISAFVGGVASQEAVKLITHQYVCTNNTYIFNGLCGCGDKYEL